MFVGFIAVIVIILVIVTLMSTGATNGSGGVDQTKATKAISEVSALAQSAGFYKTTTPNSNYDGITVASLVNAGIVASGDVSTLGATAAPTQFLGNAGLKTADFSAIESKAVQGLYYVITEHAGSKSSFDVEVVIDTTVIDHDAVDAGLVKAIEKSIEKLTASIEGVANTTVNDGAAVLNFR